MKPLQRLLAKIGARSAVKTLVEHVEQYATEDKLARDTLAPLGVDQLQKHRAALIAAWAKKPTTEAAQALVAFQTRADASATVYSLLSTQAGHAQKAKLSGLRSLFESALAEVYAGFAESRAVIVAQDAVRSEELGVACVSTEALRIIDRAEENLSSGVLLRSVDLPSAIGSIVTALAPMPAPRSLGNRETVAQPKEDRDAPFYRRNASGAGAV